MHPYNVQPRPGPWPMPIAPPRPRTEGKAVASLALGVLSLACIGGVAGLPAIILGALARRDIDRSGGTLEGRALAAGGIVSGLFGTGFGFVALLWIMGSAFAPEPADPVASVTPPALASPTAAANPQPVPAPAPSSPVVPSGIRSYGSLQVVDLDASRPLRAQLAEIVQRAHAGEGAHKRTVVLQTYTRSSDACAAIASALPDLRMQRALANVTLVRVDIEEYDRELASMKVETKTAPWFYKLDPSGAPTEGISADAWEANVPETMAPALGRFMHRPGPPRRGR